jgi:hypothetical protein
MTFDITVQGFEVLPYPMHKFHFIILQFLLYLNIKCKDLLKLSNPIYSFYLVKDHPFIRLNPEVL